MSASWSQRWVETFEESSSFDDSVLKAGARLARNSQFTDLEVAPGFVSGRIEHRGTVSTAQLGVATLRDDEWENVFLRLFESPALAVAVLVGELPDALATDSGAGSTGAGPSADFSLVPSAGEFYPDCNCGEWNGLCGHAAALVYEVASLIQADPFVLTTLRGRGRYELKAEVERARQGQGVSNDGEATHPRGADAGVSAAVAYRREQASMPYARRSPTEVGAPVTISVPPPVDSGVLVSDLDRLIRTASEHARTLLVHPERGDRLSGGVDR